IFLYSAILGAYMVMKNMRINSNDGNVIDEAYINHKQGLIYMIASTVLIRCSVFSYMDNSDTINFRLILIFIFLTLAQFTFNKNILNFKHMNQSNYLGQLYKKSRYLKNFIIFILWIIFF